MTDLFFDIDVCFLYGVVKTLVVRAGVAMFVLFNFVIRIHENGENEVNKGG